VDAGVVGDSRVQGMLANRAVKGGRTPEAVMEPMCVWSSKNGPFLWEMNANDMRYFNVRWC